MMDGGYPTSDNRYPTSTIRQPSSDIHHTTTMITGAHFLFYSTDPDADRAFFRDVLQWRSVELHGGWLIFKMPSSEAAVHPASGPFLQSHGSARLLGAVLYLMCDDLAVTIKQLEAKGANPAPVEHADWGRYTTIPLPSGGAVGLYQPSHPTAINLP
jgi:predicted enzyme related to lactoylglutathione lyase